MRGGRGWHYHATPLWHVTVLPVVKGLDRGTVAAITSCHGPGGVSLGPSRFQVKLPPARQLTSRRPRSSGDGHGPRPGPERTLEGSCRRHWKRPLAGGVRVRWPTVTVPGYLVPAAALAEPPPRSRAESESRASRRPGGRLQVQLESEAQAASGPSRRLC